jgi:hypothetical protein
MGDAFYTKTWFWLLAITMVSLIVIAIIFEYYGNQVNSWSSIPFWVWAGFAIAIFAFFVSVVLYVIDLRKVTIINQPKSSQNITNYLETVYPADYKQSIIVGSDGKPIVTQR